MFEILRNSQLRRSDKIALLDVTDQFTKLLFSLLARAVERDSLLPVFALRVASERKDYAPGEFALQRAET